MREHRERRAKLARLSPRFSTLIEGEAVPDDDREILQRFIDSLFRETTRVTRLDVVIRAEAFDLPRDLLDIIDLLPPATYPRHSLCDQLNSALKGHGWNGLYGTVD